MLEQKEFKQNFLKTWLYELSLKLPFNRKKKNTSKTNSYKKNMYIFLIVMLAIPVVHWLVFWLYVNIRAIELAFKLPTGEWSSYNFVMFWDGLTSNNNDISIAVSNTFIYFAKDLLVIFPGSLFISYFLFKRICGYKYYRVIFYLPSIISAVALVSIFKEFIKPWGPLNEIAKLFGTRVPPSGLLGTAEYATWTIVFYTIWTGFSGNFMLMNGAMMRIPLDVLEAAKIEGCGPFRELVQIILPLIWPTLATLIIFMFTGVFDAGGPILLMTGGQYKTTTIAFWIFYNVYGGGSGGGGNYNLVSAAGLCFTLVAVPMILFIRWLLERKEKTEY